MTSCLHSRQTINLGRPTSGTDQRGIRCDEYSVSKYVYHSRGGHRGSLPGEPQSVCKCAREGRGGGRRRIAPFFGDDFRGGRWPPWSFVVGFGEWSKNVTPHISISVVKNPCLTALAFVLCFVYHRSRLLPSMIRDVAFVSLTSSIRDVTRNMLAGSWKLEAGSWKLEAGSRKKTSPSSSNDFTLLPYL